MRGAAVSAREVVRPAVECYVCDDQDGVFIFSKDSGCTPMQGDVLSLAIDNETGGGMVARLFIAIAEEMGWLRTSTSTLRCVEAATRALGVKT